MTIKYNNKIIVGAGALLALAITAAAPAQSNCDWSLDRETSDARKISV